MTTIALPHQPPAIYRHVARVLWQYGMMTLTIRDGTIVDAQGLMTEGLVGRSWVAVREGCRYNGYAVQEMP